MEILNYIGGQFHPSKNKRWIDNSNPATDKIIGKVPRSSLDDVEFAVKAANAALPYWKSLSKKERASYLLKLSTKIEENIDELALLETRDTGKP